MLLCFAALIALHMTPAMSFETPSERGIATRGASGYKRVCRSSYLTCCVAAIKLITGIKQVQQWAVQLHTAAAEQQQQLLQLRDEAIVTAQKLSEAVERANQVEQQLLTTTEYQHTTKELR